MKSIFHIDYCTCHDRNVCRQTINKTDGALWLQHITKHTITSAWPSAYCRHSAVMTLQSPELRPLRWRGEECNQSIFSSALSFAYSQKAITGCSCKHFAPQHPWDTQSKRIAAISLFFFFFLHRGSPCEYTLRAECSGEGRIHKIVPGAEFVFFFLKEKILMQNWKLRHTEFPQPLLLMCNTHAIYVFKRHAKTQKEQSSSVFWEWAYSR